ncbi:hypothetical protein V1512DRAFT_254939 [Lipomyces arxii]|uniref:uncharacterized protein n=1 Tax=Lipomyces arxii TaxID=56418 RepID=UPI0034CFAB16
MTMVAESRPLKRARNNLQENRPVRVKEQRRDSDIRQYAFFSKKNTYETDNLKTEAKDVNEVSHVFGDTAKHEDGSTSSLHFSIERLNILFTAMDKVVWVFYGRDVKGVLTFSEIKRQVESISKRQFGLKDLQKIMYLYPEAYILASKLSASDYVVELPSLPNHLNTDPEFLVKRLKMFNEKCNEFLMYNKSASDLPLSLLPVGNKFGTATQSIINQRAQKLKKNASDVQILLRNENKLKPSLFENSLSLSDRKQLLQDRIRAKQVEKDIKDNSAPSPEIKQRIALLARLPSIVDVILQIQATTDGDDSVHMLLRKMVEMVRDSARLGCAPPSVNEISNAIILLAQVVPEWCSIVQVGTVASVKLLGRQSCLLTRADILTRLKAQQDLLSQQKISTNLYF